MPRPEYLQSAKKLLHSQLQTLALSMVPISECLYGEGKPQADSQLKTLALCTVAGLSWSDPVGIDDCARGLRLGGVGDDGAGGRLAGRLDCAVASRVGLELGREGGLV